ncbi:MAG: hypothetical protein ACREXS_11125 [Gammaproteobacteria bacterium]
MLGPFLPILDSRSAFTVRRAERLEDAAACIRQKIAESLSEISVAAIVTDEYERTLSRWTLSFENLR